MVLPERGELGEALAAAGVEVVVRELAVLRRTLLRAGALPSLAAGAARDAVGLRRLIRRRAVALVHSNTSVVLGGAGAAALARVPHVWHVREIYTRFGRLWPLWRRALLQAAALPCVSAATAAQFGGAPGTIVLPDGLFGDPWAAPRGGARAALGIPQGPPAIGLLGRISDWKGQDVLVRALAQAPLHERGALALLAGDAWPGAEDRLEVVLSLAERLGVRDRVHVLGFRSDVENVLGAAEVIAVPSTAPDPLPGSAVEAAAAGCAVLASAHGGLPEIIRNGVSGRLVAPGDEDELARVAAELIDSPEQRTRLGQAARSDVRKRYSPARLLHDTQALYDRLLGAGAQ